MAEMWVYLVFGVCRCRVDYFRFRGEAGFAGKLVLLGKLVSQGNWFLITLDKIFVIILVVKQITYNGKLRR